jgi:hypothetical protein
MDLQFQFVAAVMLLAALVAFNIARVRPPGWQSAILAPVVVLGIGAVTVR